MKIILKNPIESKCAAEGLQGCPELTEGVLLYVEGQEDAGRDMLIKGAAQNAPAKVKKFAKAIRELKRIPGASNYAQPLIKVADILATAKGQAGAPGQAADPGDPNAPPPPPVEVDTVAGRPDGGVVVPATARDRVSCGGLAGLAYCIRVAPGPLNLSELTVGAGCPGEVVVGAARSGDVVELPRWVARNPHGATDQRAIVRRGETLYVGVQASAANDPRCTVTWSGVRTR